jgi:hypothetical protein
MGVQGEVGVGCLRRQACATVTKRTALAQRTVQTAETAAKQARARKNGMEQQTFEYGDQQGVIRVRPVSLHFKGYLRVARREDQGEQEKEAHGRRR